MALATGFLLFKDYLGKFRMSTTVGQQWIGDEVSFVNRRLAHLAGSIGPETQAFEGPINVVQRCFDGGDAFVTELWHVDQLS